MIIAAFVLACYVCLKTKIPAAVRTWIHRSSCVVILVCSLAVWPGVCPFSSDTMSVLFIWVFRVINYIFWNLFVSFVSAAYFKWASHDKRHWNSFVNLTFIVSLLVEGVTRSFAPFLVRAIYEHG